MKVLPVGDAQGRILAADLLVAAEPVHRQLRPHLQDYVARMKQVLAGGAEMAVCIDDGGRVVGVTVFRVLEKTFSGRELYCDDLVTDEAARSSGVGRALVAYMDAVGLERGCDTFALDSGTQRQQAHKFYFREGLTVTAFHFSRKVRKP